MHVSNNECKNKKCIFYTTCMFSKPHVRFFCSTIQFCCLLTLEFRIRKLKDSHLHSGLYRQMAFDPKNSSMVDSEQKRCQLGRSCFHKCLPQSQKSNLVRILDSHYFEHQLEQKCMELHQSLFSLRISKTFSIMILGINYVAYMT